MDNYIEEILDSGNTEKILVLRNFSNSRNLKKKILKQEYSMNKDVSEYVP